MSLMLRRGAVVFAVVSLFAAGCSDDGDDTALEGEDGDDTSEVTDDTAEEREPTESATLADDTVHTSTDPAIELCEALVGRNGDEIYALLPEGALLVDHTAGGVWGGREGIRDWIDNEAGFAIFERTRCGVDEDAIATNWWSAATTTFSSETNPGQSEGIAFVRAPDGKIDSLHTLYTVTDEDTTAADPATAEERALVTAWCEALAAGDAEELLQLATDDIVITPSSRAEAEIEPLRGVTGVEQAAFMLSDDAQDLVDCSQTMISSGGWIAHTVQFVDDNGNSWGGIIAVQLRNGLVSAHHHFMGVVDADGNAIDSAPTSRSVTIETDPDPRDPQGSRSFEVTAGSGVLGCVDGTWVNEPTTTPVLGLGMEMTCDSGTREGTFTVWLALAGGDSDGPTGFWGVLEGTGDFELLDGFGEFSVIEGDLDAVRMIGEIVFTDESSVGGVRFR